MIEIPPLVTKTWILKQTGWAESTLDSKIYRGEFPRMITRSQTKGAIYSGPAVYKALKIIEEVEEEVDPFYAAIHG